MKVVVFAPSGAVASALDQLPLSDDDDVLVVAGGAPDIDAGVRTVIITPSLRAATRWAGAALGGSVAGRNLLRLTPLDPGRRFAGATRRARRLRTELADADLIVALERDGILAAWHAARRAGARAHAVYGVPAAQGRMAEGRAARAD
ncbi:hypothetical protein MK786_11420 [Microbacterium sp. CFH 31415]|uniref:hypothetical protein n=1 Tax=Microbacterium sp. CFH 31415 TaxID=2921732 RepID=UPI001F1337D2|nr:hypothetical protein [Microbacterium sp. CFH 31415]MCH6231349.1 hypothetical protein [Microbacterium sp. CFH 31415]